MREEYDFTNARKNPYTKELKHQVTVKISPSVTECFKEQAAKAGISYQTPINVYLADCVKNKRE